MNDEDSDSSVSSTPPRRQSAHAKKPKVTYFQDDWLHSDEYKDWICRSSDGSKQKYRCRLCRADRKLSNMGESSLISHAKVCFTPKFCSIEHLIL